MRVVAWLTGWQCASETKGAADALARPRTGMGTASHVAGRSFGIHEYNQRPRGAGGAPPG